MANSRTVKGPVSTPLTVAGTTMLMSICAELAGSRATEATAAPEPAIGLRQPPLAISCESSGTTPLPSPTTTEPPAILSGAPPAANAACAAV